MNITKQMKLRKTLFLLFNIVALIAFYSPLSSLFALSLNNELYSHIPLIPIISAYLFYTIKKEVPFFAKPSYVLGGIILTASIIPYIIATAQEGSLNNNDYLSLMMLSAFLFWNGGFIFFNGIEAFKKAIFPLTFLILMIPIPSTVLNGTVSLLQHASADISYFIFKLTGVPIFRDGLIFHLPNVSVRVAKECSGIRSSIALFITCILMQHFILRTASRKLILILIILPLAILKNSIRIVTLSLLAVYVDTSFLTNSKLHSEGGILFFVIALIILMPILWILRKSEK